MKDWPSNNLSTKFAILVIQMVENLYFKYKSVNISNFGLELFLNYLIKQSYCRNTSFIKASYRKFISRRVFDSFYWNLFHLFLIKTPKICFV